MSETKTKQRRALITGITGQDGSYLSEYLLSLGYQVFGIVRRNSVPDNQTSRIQHLFKSGSITIFYGDLLDMVSLMDIMRKTMPDEIYNLAAQSHVRISSETPIYTANVNSIGVSHLLEAYKQVCPTAKLYQASTSEMFGNSVEIGGTQNEDTAMMPVSPYGCSKLFAHHLVRHYRHAYGLFCCGGILFNHESPRRGTNFVTSKVVRGALMIKYGLATQLELGNLDTYRDWGHAKDYVKAMHLMLQRDVADDLVISTGQTHSVRELCAYVFGKLGLDYQQYVIQNERYLRPEELVYLKGDSSRARKLLGWEPEYTFETLMDDMMAFWEGEISKMIK